MIGLFLGVMFTFGLFLAIAHYERGGPAPPPPVLDDLHIATVMIEPPPAMVQPETSVPDTTMIGFELAPEKSPVKIAVSPPDLSAILPEEMSKAPTANAQLGPLLTDFKPKMDLSYDAQHIYQKSEVDRVPEILSRPDPQISSRVRDNADTLRVTLVVVINADGEIGNIRLTKSSGKTEFDQLMMESLRDWVFAPAMKNGKKVRCLIEQGITVQWSRGSVFRI